MATIATHAPPMAVAAADDGDDSVWTSRMSDAEQALLCCQQCSRLLREPLLLACLHSCCRVCLTRLPTVAPSDGDARRVLCPSCGVATAVASCRENPFVAARLRALLATLDGPPPCSTCSDAGGAEGAANIGEGGSKMAAQTPAEYWCVECARFLCTDCRMWHDKFNKQHTTGPAVPEVPSGRSVPWTGGSAAGAAASVTVVPTSLTGTLVCCPMHGIGCEFFCIDCAGLKCLHCTKACMDAKHDVGDIAKARVQAHARRLADDIRAQLAALRREAAPRVRACAELGRQLALAERRDVNKVRANKTLATEAVSLACGRAHEALVREHAALQADVERTAAAERQLSAKVRHALAYADVVLHVNDVGSLLGQQKALLACLRRLEADLDRLPVALDDGGDRWSVLAPPADDGDGLLAEAVRKWIGWPREHKGFPLVPDSSAVADSEGVLPLLPEQQQLQQQLEQQQLTTNSGSTSHEPDSPASQQLPAAAASAGRSSIGGTWSDEPALRFCDADVSFGMPVDCRDVAFTSDGRLLLAALKHGLKQYEPSGRKLATWRPARSYDGSAAIVSSVDVLAAADGDSSAERVVVSLIDLQCVVVLQRDPAAGRDCYGEQLRVGLQLHPFRVSSFGQRFAVAGAHVSDSRKSRGYHVVVGREWSPGPHLELFALTSVAGDRGSGSGGSCAASALLLRQQCERDITSLALTDRCVVVLSKRPAPQSYAGVAYVLEALDFDGRPVWCIDSQHEMLDVCSAPAAAAAAHVIYVTLPRRERVCAYSADDGRWLADVLGSNTHTVTSPGRLSLGYCEGRRPALAVLIAQDAVVVYRAVAPASGST